jgi:hypothetical protein
MKISETLRRKLYQRWQKEWSQSRSKSPRSSSVKRLPVFLFFCFIALTSHAAELWRGTLHLTGGKKMTGVIEDVSATSIKFVSQGTAYWLKIADLPAATRGELDIGIYTSQATPEDKAAYLADLPRRQALIKAEQAKVRAAQDQQRAAREAERRALTYEQEQRDKKQAELRALQKREEERRRTEALEQIALELQLRRLNGR